MTARRLALDEDPSLSADDVMRITGLSRAYVYEVMHQMEHEKFGRAIRVRRTVLEQWRKEHTKCGSTSTNEEISGGFAAQREASSFAVQRGKRAPGLRAGSATDSSASSPIQPIRPRTARRSRAPQSDS